MWEGENTDMLNVSDLISDYQNGDEMGGHLIFHTVSQNSGGIVLELMVCANGSDAENVLLATIAMASEAAAGADAGYFSRYIVERLVPHNHLVF